MKTLPGFTYVDLGPDGGPFDQSDRPKVELHTTEGSTLAGAEAAYRNYPPHLGYDPVRRIKRQYISLDRHSYATRNSEAEDDYVIQVEIVGFASQTHTWSGAVLQNIATDLFDPLERVLGVPRAFKRFYRADEGIVLASPNSPIRLTNAQWRSFSGYLGHQHAPAPDDHWDPGGFPISKVFSLMEGDDMTPKELLDVRFGGSDWFTALEDYKDDPGTLGHLLRGLADHVYAVRTYVDTLEASIAAIRSENDALEKRVNDIYAGVSQILDKLNEGTTP